MQLLSIIAIFAALSHSILAVAAPDINSLSVRAPPPGFTQKQCEATVRDLRSGASVAQVVDRERLEASQRNDVVALKRQVDAAVRKNTDDRNLARDLCR